MSLVHLQGECSPRRTPSTQLEYCQSLAKRAIMQFVEKNSYDLRVAVYRAKREESGLEFLLIPMIHVGSQQYYDEVHRRLSSCDLILAEGVKSRKIRSLTSYQVLGLAPRLGLVTQKNALDLTDLKDRIVHSDIAGEEFDRRWTELPLFRRALAMMVHPAAYAYMAIFGNREILAAELALEDLPSQEEALRQSEDADQFDDLLITERDRVLIDKIQSLQAPAGASKQLVGVPYGAGHMRGLCAFLLGTLQYRIVGSEWLTVFVL